VRHAAGAYTGVGKRFKFLKAKRFTGFSTETAQAYYYYYF
jgi:hypothetical protein